VPGEHLFYRMLGARLRAVRVRNKIDQKTLGAAVGVHASQISNIEAGRRKVKAAQVERWCMECGVAIGDVWPPR
jgi:transcriptional regulator with XRE-family HTH domain